MSLGDRPASRRLSSIGVLAGTVQEATFYLLLLLLPFSKASVEISFGVLLIGWIVERVDPATRFRTAWVSPEFRPLAWSLGAYLLACALSIPWSDIPALSLRGFVSKWLEYLLLFVIVTDVARRPGVGRRALQVTACASIGVVLVGVRQEMLMPFFSWGHPAFEYRRMTGPYTNPIDLATYLMVVIPLFFARALSQHRRLLRLGWYMLLLVLTICLGRTEASGAWLGLVVGLVVWLVRSPSAPMRRAVAVLLFANGLAALAFLFGTGRAGATVFSDIGTIDRWAMWQAALHMIQDRPILGHGLNTFMANYLEYWVAGERQPRYAHNCYLQVAAETGVLGLLSFLTLLGCIARRLWVGATQATGEHQTIVIGLLAALAAFTVHAALDTNFYALRQAALFWALAGLAVGLTVRGAVSASSSSSF